MDLPMTLQLDRMLPEFIVAGTGMAAIVTELMLPVGRRAVATAWTSVIGLGIALVVLLVATPTGYAMHVVEPTNVGGTMKEMLVTGWLSDGFSIYCRAVVLVGGLLLFLLSMGYMRRMDRGHGEFCALLLFALLGVMLVSGVNDLLGLFVCLELVTILAYILAAFRRNHLGSTEAGLKYLVIGAVSTALLLLGIAFVYGHTGSLSFEVLAEVLRSGPPTVFLILGVGLMLAGLLFKIGGVPFHVWIPDVYQGAPTPVTAFLSTASKAAGIILLLRFGVVVFGDGPHAVNWVPMLSVLAVVTLLYGSLCAIAQRNIKRMLAYSSIGHAGYLLMGLVALAASAGQGGVDGATHDAGAPAAILFYLLAYTLTTLTAFTVIVLVSGATGGEHDGHAYRGLHKRSPLLALAMLFALLSLAGVPPMSGFFAKFLILKALVDQGLYVLAFIGAGAVVVGLYFYFLWLKEIYFYEPSEPIHALPIPRPWASTVVLIIGIAAMLGMGIFMGPFHEWAAEAAQSLVATR